MTRPSRANRRDANEPALVKIWQDAGCAWYPQQPGQGCDGFLVVPGGHVLVVEIKNPATRWELTPDELRMRDECEKRNVAYNVILYDFDARALIGLQDKPLNDVRFVAYVDDDGVYHPTGKAE